MKNINANKAHELFLAKKAIFVDVREPVETNTKCIEPALFLPSSGSLKISEKIQENIAIIVLCRSGNRSSKACPKIAEQFPNHDVYNLDGGINAWENAGFPLSHQNKSKILPLEQQVQLTIGVLVLIASLLAYFITPNFSFVTIFIGVGLIFAGLTGTCGLALLIARMPWNKTAKQKNCRL